jgi:hypothetical protein
VVPYFEIATQYGYANYMFQTNQGPSFPAHQFLLSGTSAPIYDDNDTNLYWQWFAAENGPKGQGVPYGCTATGTVVADIDTSGSEQYLYNGGCPCYNHNSLVDVLENPQGEPSPISWRYYAHAATPKYAAPDKSLWTAPNANQEICGLNQQGTACNSNDWNLYVKGVFPDNPQNYPNSFSPILTDLGADTNQQQCTLPAVSWVIPDGKWSDHGGEDTDNGGPSWVAAIVNAVGGYDNSGNLLATNCGYWTDTAILITWDDWGGWYDHVLPWRCNNTGTCHGYSNGTGQWYVYGFRVPLLVVSAYTPKGYISGALPSPGEQAPYVHDFGSILNFIEYALGVNGFPIAPNGGIYPNYNYADYLAPDVYTSGNCTKTVCPYSLFDFFPSFSTPRTFTPISANVGYPMQCFITPKDPKCFGSSFAPSDPDADNQ